MTCAAAGYDSVATHQKRRAIFSACLQTARPTRSSHWRNTTAGLPDCHPRLSRDCAEAWGEPAADPDFHDGAFLLPRAKIRQAVGRVAARSRPLRRASRRLSRFAVLPPRHALVAFGLWLQHVVEGRCAGPHGRARHAGMAAGQGGRAYRRMFSGDRHRSTAGDLSVHRQQSGRSGTSQTPDCGRHHRPPAATAGRRRAFRRRARA